MRIINGRCRGKRIVAPKNLPVRPTTDFAKESLFNILNNQIDFEEITVLDLFSGTGNIAYEFASRGAKEVLCIDQNYQCVSFINKTSKILEFNQLAAFRNDAFKYLTKYPKTYDLIFADPPYQLEKIDQLIDLIFKNKLLNNNGIFILEHDARWDFSTYPYFVQHRKYGHVNFSFFSIK